MWLDLHLAMRLMTLFLDHFPLFNSPQSIRWIKFNIKNCLPAFLYNFRRNMFLSHYLYFGNTMHQWMSDWQRRFQCTDYDASLDIKSLWGQACYLLSCSCLSWFNHRRNWRAWASNDHQENWSEGHFEEGISHFIELTYCPFNLHHHPGGCDCQTQMPWTKEEEEVCCWRWRLPYQRNVSVRCLEHHEFIIEYKV